MSNQKVKEVQPLDNSHEEEKDELDQFKVVKNKVQES